MRQLILRPDVTSYQDAELHLRSFESWVFSSLVQTVLGCSLTTSGPRRPASHTKVGPLQEEAEWLHRHGYGPEAIKELPSSEGTMAAR